MQHSRLTLAFKSLTSSAYFLSPPPYPPYPFMFLAVFLYLLLPLPPPPTRSRFFNEILAVSEPVALSYYSLSLLILLILSVSRNSTLTHLPLHGSLDALFCDVIALTPGLAFFLPMFRMLAAVFCPIKRAPSFNFQKAYWEDFAFYFDSYCSSTEKYSFLSLSSAAAFFTCLALNAAEFSIPFGRVKRQSKARWSPEARVANFDKFQ